MDARYRVVRRLRDEHARLRPGRVSVSGPRSAASAAGETPSIPASKRAGPDSPRSRDACRMRRRRSPAAEAATHAPTPAAAWVGPSAVRSHAAGTSRTVRINRRQQKFPTRAPAADDARTGWKRDRRGGVPVRPGGECPAGRDRDGADPCAQREQRLHHVVRGNHPVPEGRMSVGAMRPPPRPSPPRMRSP